MFEEFGEMGNLIHCLWKCILVQFKGQQDKICKNCKYTYPLTIPLSEIYSYTYTLHEMIYVNEYLLQDSDNSNY